MTESKGKVKVNGRFVYPEVHAFEAAEERTGRKDGQWNVTITRLHREVMANKASAAKALANCNRSTTRWPFQPIVRNCSTPRRDENSNSFMSNCSVSFQTPDAVGD